VLRSTSRYRQTEVFMPCPGRSRVAFARARCLTITAVVLLAAWALPQCAAARTTGPVHPGRLAGDPIGECFAATLGYEGPDSRIRVPGTLRAAESRTTRWGGMDSLPPWLCRRPLSDFEARARRLTGVARAFMALDRALVEFEACFRSGREAMLMADRRVTPQEHCFVVAGLPPHLSALVDSVRLELYRVGAARSDAERRSDLAPAERALVESVHMEVLSLVRLFASTFPDHMEPDRSRPREFVESWPYSWDGLIAVRVTGDDFLYRLWEVRGNLDSWLSQLVVEKGE
jgi:hypothetical protein